MLHGPPRRRRPRPVADAPIDALLTGAEDLAKGWLLALVEEAPLGDASQILAADLASDGPRICDAVVRALADDSDLRRLEPGGALEPLVSRSADLAGGRDPESVARAVDSLHAVIWSALRAELPWPDADLISDLAERLALVTEYVRAAALRRGAGQHRAAEEDEPQRPDSPRGPERRVRIAEPAPTREPESGPPVRVMRMPERDPGTGETGHERKEHPALWVGAVEDEIRRSERSGTPLSLLLVELDDGERVLAADPGPAGVATFGKFAQAVRSAVRRDDILACESDSRAWIIAKATARAGARALATRVAEAVEAAPPWRGAPLTVSVGLAVLGDDGHDAETLINAAEEAKFAAAASGMRLLPEDSPGGGEDPIAG